MYAALRAIPVPDDVVARFFHAGSLLREHRGDGHIAALMSEGVGGLEAHVLFALGMDMPAEKFGRIHHLPAAQLAAVIGGMRDRGLIGDDGWLSEPGRAARQRVEALTDDLAARPYQSLEPDELDELMAILELLATLLLAAQDQHEGSAGSVRLNRAGQIVARFGLRFGEPASRMTFPGDAVIGPLTTIPGHDHP